MSLLCRVVCRPCGLHLRACTFELIIGRQALKYTLLNDELYHQTLDGLLLKCLDSNQSRLAMGEVREGICGTHQLAPKM